ncbi:MAG: hypothetical protein WCI73_08140 [Phycisphaerae bacterium]
MNEGLIPVTQDVLADIREAYEGIERVKAAGEKHAGIVRAVDMYYQLLAIPEREPLHVLGLFAVIESLLTHNPNGDYDSLEHQIRKKMALLNTRFTTPLDTSHFGNAPFDTLWKKFYEYRSKIAHGAAFDFKKDLKMIQNATVAYAFLDGAAKSLLRHALKEPHLMLDLQAC